MTQKAFILAAGLGTRLRPLTLSLPKPALPFLGVPALELMLRQLSSAGFSKFMINTHYLEDGIKNVLSRYSRAAASSLSFEKEILGTGGAMNPVRPWFGSAPLLAVNGDIVADFSFRDFFDFYRTMRASGPLRAVMMLTRSHMPETTPVYSKAGKIVAIGGSSPENSTAHTFACAQILDPLFFEDFPKTGSFSIIDQYQKWLKAGEPIYSFIHSGFWADIGEPHGFLHLQLEILKNPDCKKLLDRLKVRDDEFFYDPKNQSLYVGNVEFNPRLSIQNCLVIGPTDLSSPRLVLDDKSYTSSIVTRDFVLKA